MHKCMWMGRFHSTESSNETLTERFVRACRSPNEQRPSSPTSWPRSLRDATPAASEWHLASPTSPPSCPSGQSHHAPIGLVTFDGMNGGARSFVWDCGVRASCTLSLVFRLPRRGEGQRMRVVLRRFLYVCSCTCGWGDLRGRSSHLIGMWLEGGRGGSSTFVLLFLSVPCTE
jgi:hypothetical protein